MTALALIAALALTSQPALSKDNTALPRIASPDAAGARINAGLARVDANWAAFQRDCRGQSSGETSTGRMVETAMAGPAYLSLVVRYDYYCGGPYPDTGTLALVYDLKTGWPVNWQKLLPARFAVTATRDTAGDGTSVGQISAPRLQALYLAQDHAPAECAEVLADPSLAFILWPDAKAGGLAMEPSSLPHAIKACAETRVIPLSVLRRAGLDAGLLNAVAAAHAARRGR